MLIKKRRSYLQIGPHFEVLTEWSSIHEFKGEEGNLASKFKENINQKHFWFADSILYVTTLRLTLRRKLSLDKFNYMHSV